MKIRLKTPEQYAEDVKKYQGELMPMFPEEYKQYVDLHKSDIMEANMLTEVTFLGVFKFAAKVFSYQ